MVPLRTSTLPYENYLEPQGSFHADSGYVTAQLAHTHKGSHSIKVLTGYTSSFTHTFLVHSQHITWYFCTHWWSHTAHTHTTHIHTHSHTHTHTHCTVTVTRTHSHSHTHSHRHTHSHTPVHSHWHMQTKQKFILGSQNSSYPLWRMQWNCILERLSAHKTGNHLSLLKSSTALPTGNNWSLP